MSFISVTPQALLGAASDFAAVDSMIKAANTIAALPTTGVLAAGTDEVSARIATLFGAHGQEYQALSAKAAAYGERFLQNLVAGAGSYASAEAASASPLQTVEQNLLGAINAPTQTLFGRPLIGNGADGQTIAGVGQQGGAGGIL